MSRKIGPQWPKKKPDPNAPPLKRSHASGLAERSTPEYLALYGRIRAMWLDGNKYPADPTRIKNRAKIAHITRLMNHPTIRRVQAKGWHLCVIKRVKNEAHTLPHLQRNHLDMWYARPYLFIVAATDARVSFFQDKNEIHIVNNVHASRWRIALEINSMDKAIGFKDKFKEYERDIGETEPVLMDENMAWCLPATWQPTSEMGYSEFRRASAEYMEAGVFGNASPGEGIDNMAVMFIANFSLAAQRDKYANLPAQRQAKAARTAIYKAFNLTSLFRTS